MLVFTHPAMLRHEVPPGHPERPARLEAVLAALAPLKLETREAPLASRAALLRAHSEAHLAAVEAAAPGAGLVQLDADTHMSPGSLEAAYRAAGAVIAAVDATLGGETAVSFCAVRPPGHHAEPDRVMGFCLFNSIGVAALHALDHHGLTRVAVVDFDVHHGNGTQALAERDARLFFASTHQMPLWPGTGAAEERGIDGNVLNAPLKPGDGGAAFRAAMDRVVLPALEAARPELILVSAGFDAHAADPLAQLEFQDDDYAWAARRLKAVASAVCGGRIVSTLEGGYDLAALGRSTAAFVAALAA